MQHDVLLSLAFQAYGQTFIYDDDFLAWVGIFAAVCNASGRILWGTVADRYSFKVGLFAVAVGSEMCGGFSGFARFSSTGVLQGFTRFGETGYWLVSWCFEPSQPQDYIYQG